MSTPRISRRDFGKLAGILGVSAPALAACSSDESHEDRRATDLSAAENESPFAPNTDSGDRGRPNILFIMADDLGWRDLSCYGAPHIATPNIDSIAADGVRYTNAYSASNVCSPTRIGLYTGRYPGRLVGGLKEPIIWPTAQDGIPPEHPTLASLLKSQGYRTAMFGKWHCGTLPWFSPLQSGWDSFFGSFGGGLDYFSKLDVTGVYDLVENDVEYRDLGYFTDLITDKVIEHVNGQGDEPWLINLNYTAPHWPWEGPEDRAESDRIAKRLQGGDWMALYHTDGGSLDKYVEMVQYLDASIGRVIDALKDSGRYEDTLIVFSSDNGGERFSYQWPLTGAKGGYNEGSVRVPNILSWPRHIGGGQVDARPVVTMDWTATLVELAGAEPSADHPFDGTSLVSHLFDELDESERSLFWRHHKSGALRRGDWKYVRADGKEMLYDLNTDLMEKADKAGLNPALVAELREEWNTVNAGLIPYPPDFVTGRPDLLRGPQPAS